MADHQQVWSQVVRRINFGHSVSRKEKKAVEDRQGTFTPFVISVDGLLHREAEHLLKHIATSIHCTLHCSSQMEKPYAETCAFVRAQLLFALVRVCQA